MPIEIERKFLVKDTSWCEGTKGILYRQGYIYTGPPVAVRVRIMGESAVITIKKAVSTDTSESSPAIYSNEYEYEIHINDAESMLNSMCESNIIEKTRFKTIYAGKTWEIDEFHGLNEGLIIAEIELDNMNEEFEKPPWMGMEVSGDSRYLNSSLSRLSYRDW